MGIGITFAQQGKQAVGFNVEYGTEISNVGFGLKYQYNISSAIRFEPSVNYFLKNDGLSMFDLNVNAHYLCPVTNNVKLYPLVGFTYTNWRTDACEEVQVDGDQIFTAQEEAVNKDKFGINLGAGLEYNFNACWAMNVEAKYRFISSLDQFVIGRGLIYKF